MGLINGRFLPLVYGLLSNKTEETYVRFFESLPFNVNTHRIIVDFERGMMNAIENTINDTGLVINVAFIVGGERRCMLIKKFFKFVTKFCLHAYRNVSFLIFTKFLDCWMQISLF